MSRLRRRNFARNETALSALAAHMRSRRIRNLRVFPNLFAAQ